MSDQAPSDQAPSGRSVAVRTQVSEAYAVILVALLAEHDITAWTLRTPVYDGTTDIYTFESDAAMANVYIAATEHSGGDGVAICAACSEEVPADFGACWSCGAAMSDETATQQLAGESSLEASGPTAPVKGSEDVSQVAIGVAIVLALANLMFFADWFVGA